MRKIIIKEMKKEKIPGGLASGMDISSFDADSIKKGIKAELEHTSDVDIATEIAMDHLAEDPLYYDKLKQMETTKVQVKLKIKKKINENDSLQNLISEEVEAVLFIEQVLSSCLETTDLEEGLANFVRNSFNAAKQEIDRVKQMAGDKAYTFLQAGVGKINNIFAKLKSMGFIGKQKMRELQAIMKVFLIPKHAKFLGSIMIAVLKSLVMSGLQAVLPTVLVTNITDLKKNVEDYKEKFLKPINDFVEGLGSIVETVKSVLKAGEKGLYKFCKDYLGIDLEEIKEYIPDALKLIKDLANPMAAVRTNLGLLAEDK